MVSFDAMLCGDMLFVVYGSSVFSSVFGINLFGFGIGMMFCSFYMLEVHKFFFSLSDCHLDLLW